METLIKDAMSNYYIANNHKEGSLFLSSYIKFSSNKWECKHHLNVWKCVPAFGDESEGFVDFNKWKHENIIE